MSFKNLVGFPVGGDTLAKKLTICEVHRQIRKAMEAEGLNDQKAIKLLTMAYLSGKAMSAKLKKFKAGWDKGWWPLL